MRDTHRDRQPPPSGTRQAFDRFVLVESFRETCDDRCGGRFPKLKVVDVWIVEVWIVEVWIVDYEPFIHSRELEKSRPATQSKMSMRSQRPRWLLRGLLLGRGIGERSQTQCELLVGSHSSMDLPATATEEEASVPPPHWAPLLAPTCASSCRIAQVRQPIAMNQKRL
ncbi:hypothetical protein EYF80_013865 [Liparis tanakae]|uniref:Uncharacterized protein n=1 Tax=Liparis tanakae TaxID=230148 RepID=A0A4Z2IEA8_9TELE|nr:hypothetical protein EYF80_013865 [Liparis tanakae]